VRWNRPGHGLVPPAGFIPIAEQSDLICDIGRWVLRNALRDAAAWGSGAGSSLEVAVNVSGRHVLSGTLVSDVQDALRAADLDPRRLTVEITETVLVVDLPIVIEQLEELRRMGVSIAIDDFGTGYTSLNHLRYLPADVIKIDRSFVAQLDRPREAPLVRLINDIGHTLALVVVAEGVETAEQQEQLVMMGCDRLQGYYFSRPVPADELFAWMARLPLDVQSSSR
jgi:EAL domain-containing protein (putative c-di-GMP-specific phosphodiesterase class I)